MKYPRPAYGDPSVPTVSHTALFGMGTRTLPVLEKPISIRENFRRAWTRQDPLWVPNSMTDTYGSILPMLNGMPEADFGSRERQDWTDWFGVEWTYVPEAGGSMAKVGSHFLEDVLDWEKVVKFPRLSDYDFAGEGGKFMKGWDGEQIIQCDVGLGCTERLVSLFGGYSEAMVAMAMEPEATRDLLEAFADWEITVVDELLKTVPLDLITYHDDWGTERDTFFSEKMMEEIVFPPTKRIFDHIRSRGGCLELHSCGHIERFIPYMLDLKVDLLQIQARCNDIAAYKRKWGDRVGFDVSVFPAPGATKEQLIADIRRAVDDYGAGGGFYSSVFAEDPELVWTGASELFYYSREKYDAEREAKDNG